MDKNEVWSLDFLSVWVSLLFDNIVWHYETEMKPFSIIRSIGLRAKLPY